MFDLSFRLFRTRIRVSVWFWVLAVVFGWMMGVHQIGGWPIFVLWVFCEFVASIAKEIGHVLAGQYFGYPGTVVLSGMSSQAVGDYDQAPRWQRIIIHAAGPIAGLWFYFVVYMATHPLMSRLAQFGRAEEYIFWGLMFLSFLTLFWSLFSLLPMLPTDGGLAMQSAVGYLVGRRDFLVATIISILVALAFIGYSLYVRAHPGTFYLGDIVRPLYHADLRENRFASFNPDPLFFACMFGYYAFLNIVALFRKPKALEPSRRVV